MNKPRYKEDGSPKYVHCYDNGGESADRYTICFTRTGRTGSNRHKQINDGNMYVSMDEKPTHPQGICCHDSAETPIDYPSYKHLGKKITFKDLPNACQKLVKQDYDEIWTS